MENIKLPTVEELRKVPTNETVESVIVEMKVSNWKEVLGEKKLKEQQDLGKFQNSDNQIVLIIKTDSKGFIREENLIYDKDIAPTDRSKYGRFITRYGVPEVRMKVSVDFDKDGKSTILLTK